MGVVGVTAAGGCAVVRSGRVEGGARRREAGGAARWASGEQGVLLRGMEGLRLGGSAAAGGGGGPGTRRGVVVAGYNGASTPPGLKSVYEAAGVQKLGRDAANTTYYPTAGNAAAVGKKWYVVDAEGKRLGRLAVEVANLLRGKDQPTFSHSMDMGAYVIVLNAEKVAVTGKKLDDKIYKSHSHKARGMKEEKMRSLLARIPERVVEKAVKGMLPHNSMGRSLFTHLKVYRGTAHPHEAQQPITVDIGVQGGQGVGVRAYKTVPLKERLAAAARANQ